MLPFHYIEAHSLDEAVALLSQPGAAAMGGGTDLLPQVKDGVVPAELLVGLAAIPGMAAIAETDDGGLTIGAAATIADVAAHPVVRRRYAALGSAAGGLATPQIRNEGTIGGNLGQRPRCWYYRSPLIPCLKKGVATIATPWPATPGCCASPAATAATSCILPTPLWHSALWLPAWRPPGRRAGGC